MEPFLTSPSHSSYILFVYPCALPTRCRLHTNHCARHVVIIPRSQDTASTGPAVLRGGCPLWALSTTPTLSRRAVYGPEHASERAEDGVRWNESDSHGPPRVDKEAEEPLRRIPVPSPLGTACALWRSRSGRRFSRENDDLECDSWGAQAAPQGEVHEEAKKVPRLHRLPELGCTSLTRGALFCAVLLVCPGP